MEPLISVIIPVYKVEEYLDRCVSSVVNQTYKNLEIILVDDGSPDRCPQMCDEWAKKDSRIKVIHKENGGAGRARNIGFSCSKGDIISFVDSDDFLSHDMYECLNSYMENDIDIVECDHIEVNSDEAVFDETNDIKPDIYSDEAAMSEHVKDRIFRQLIWNKLYRRSVVDEVKFPEGKLIDDEFWMFKVIGNSKNLIRINKKLYAYRQQSESVMHRSFSLKRLHAVEAKCERLDYLKIKYPQLVSEAKINLWQTCLYLGQMSLKYLDKNDQNKCFACLITSLGDYEINKSDMALLSFQYKLWAILSKMSLKVTCRIRNVFGIGI